MGGPELFILFVLAVVLAPLAEEYFFRGVLFRTLHRELGDWRALVLSAAFFAIFHPPLAWVPVACVGVLTAWLFRTRSVREDPRTRALGPIVDRRLAQTWPNEVVPASSAERVDPV